MRKSQQNTSRHRASKRWRLTRERLRWGRLMQAQAMQIMSSSKDLPADLLARMVRQGKRWNCSSMKALEKLGA